MKCHDSQTPNGTRRPNKTIKSFCFFCHLNAAFEAFFLKPPAFCRLKQAAMFYFSSVLMWYGVAGLHVMFYFEKWLDSLHPLPVFPLPFTFFFFFTLKLAHVCSRFGSYWSFDATKRRRWITTGSKTASPVQDGGALSRMFVQWEAWWWRRRRRPSFVWLTKLPANSLTLALKIQTFRSEFTERLHANLP